MIFWIAAILIALLVSGLFLRALTRNTKMSEPQGQDVNFYRDQLKALDRDIARKLITEEEAENLRVEISRRLLAADKNQRKLEKPKDRGAPIGVAIGIFVFLGLGSALLYRDLGAPGYADVPIEKRLAFSERLREERPNQALAETQANAPVLPENPELTDLVGQLREALRAQPDDIIGHRLLAQNEAALGNFRAAYEAQNRMISLLGDGVTGAEYSQLGELMILATGGYISPEAEQALNRALDLDPRDGVARYYLGQSFYQTGRPDVTFEYWQSLLEEGPESAPWIAPIRAQIAVVAAEAGIRYRPPPAPQSLPGPDAETIAAADAMSDEDRRVMIEGMVEGLAARLATEGGSAEEWARLISSLAVLGRDDQARAIADEAQTVFADVPDALTMINEAASGIGAAP